jgi:hypothetical protein
VFASPAWNVCASPVKTRFTSAGSARYTTRPKIGKREENTSPYRRQRLTIQP